MSLGVRYYLGEIDKGDTAELYGALREREGVVSQEEIASVAFTVQRPNGIIEPTVAGEVEDDGQGYYQWTDTDEPGSYLAQAQFTLINGQVKSVMVNFVVVDAFDTTPPTLPEIVAEEVWMRLEDCFDAFEGGPKLRDETLANFDEEKIMRFIPEVILDINVQMPPTTGNIADFAQPAADGTSNPILPLLAKGVLCKTIQHLVRSYSEIPVPQGGQVVYEDRTRYLQAWQAIYKSEHEDYYTMVRLWKRGFLNYGKSAMLVSSKAGRLFFSGSIMRSRNIGRGFY